ncbi:MAG: hypothetical protein ACI4IS_01760 [Acutalibacteraceae bacterium]
MIYSICGLYVKLTPEYDFLKSRAEKYLVKNDDSITPHIDLDSFKSKLVEVKNDENATPQMLEYAQKGAELFEQMLSFDGFVLHSCAIEYKGKAYLFTGNSGAGKSTHARMWRECFGSDVRYINEDKPIIRKINGSFFACGNPFSGKYDNNSNIILPIGGVCKIEKSNENTITKLDKKTSFAVLMSQTLTHLDGENMIKLLELMDSFLSETKVYELKCTVSHESAKIAYNEMAKK